MGKTTTLLWMGVLVLGLAGSALGGYVVGTWTGSLEVPQWGTVEKVHSFPDVPANAYVTDMNFELRVDNTVANTEGFYCEDYIIYIGNETRGETYLRVWSGYGARRDEGADDDLENDTDIELAATCPTAFDGDPVNQEWSVRVSDVKADHGTGPIGIGRLEEFTVRITYQLAYPDLFDAGESYRSFSPTTVRPGEDFEVNCRIQNGGDAAAGPFAVSFYVSRDTNITTDDYHLGDETIGGLGAGQVTDCHFSRSFPLHFGPPGTYYVGWIIDRYGRVAESNEGNNTAYKQGYQLTVLGLPDLVDGGESYRDFTPTTIAEGQQLHAWCRIQNDGDADAGPFGVGFYLSTDTTITTADYYIGGLEEPGLGQGQSTTSSCSTGSPYFPPAGTYYVGWIIDGPDRVAERNEDNNTAYKEGYQLTVLGKVIVPDVVGMGRSQAESAITAAELAVGSVWLTSSDTVPEGDVIGQDPSGGTEVSPGSQVELTVSLGPMGTETVVVPNVVGMSQAQAASAITAASLVVGPTTQSDSDTVQPGHVISQNPAAGSSAVPGSAVNLVISSGSQPVGPVVPGAVAHWKLDETEGPIAFDSAGDNDGVLYGNPLWLSQGGIIGGALEFGGIDDYVACGTFNPSAATGKLTVCLWANWNGLSEVWQGLIAKRDSWDASDMMWQIEANKHAGELGFFRQGSRPYDGDPILPIGEWAHVAASFDGATATFYFDGEPTGSGPFSFGSDTQAGVVLGAADRNGGNSFNGALDDVRFYDQALSQTQIRVVMAAGATDVTAPGDIVQGVPNDGDWPGGERPDLAIDDTVGTKYLHFKGDEGPSGLRITPSVGATVVTGLTFTTANDFAGRDPIAFELSGSNEGLNGPYTLIVSGDIVDFSQATEWPRLAKNATMIVFDNAVAYKHYQLLITAIRGPVGDSVDSMQIAEIELLGVVAGRGTGDLLAHWAFDETAGRVASDSAGTCDGVLMGGPLWQPSGGKVGGALRFDGSSDCVLTDFVLNPADGPLSAFAWVKGGGPGQVVVSQEGSQAGLDWLVADPAGRLMTRLGGTGSGRFGASLSSTTVITDGRWHEVGFVWDGTNRTLYVDGVAVARDRQTQLTCSTGGLNIGAGKNLDAGTFFNGLIDDVRIYDSAVKP